MRRMDVRRLDWSNTALPRVENQFNRCICGRSWNAVLCPSPDSRCPESADSAFMGSKSFQAKFSRTNRNPKTSGSHLGIVILFRSPIHSSVNSALENIPETMRSERSSADRNESRLKSQEIIGSRLKLSLASSQTNR
jgi:hypothetical protein